MVMGEGASLIGLFVEFVDSFCFVLVVLLVLVVTLLVLLLLLPLLVAGCFLESL